jgi:hypothetical protein
MDLLRHIFEKIKNRDVICMLGLFFLSGLGLAVDERSFVPLLAFPLMGMIFIGVYVIFTGIKSWRSELAFRKLTPEQIAILFGDLVEQSKWDKETKRALESRLSKKIKEPSD